MLANIFFENTLKKFDISYWELNDLSSNDFWSDEFYKSLKLEKSKNINFSYFLKSILDPNCVALFKKNYTNYKVNNLDFRQSVRLKEKTGDYTDFTCYTSGDTPVDLKSENKLIFFQKINDYNESENAFSYQETATLTSTGSWFVDFKNKKSYWDSEAKKILGYPENYVPSLSKSSNYYTSDCLQQASDLFLKCATIGEPFDAEIKMLTYTNEEIWMRSIGKPVYDNTKNVIGIKGVFQNINEAKKRELTLQKSINIIASQNSRLFNFAHIVSHNLRSHSSNLSLLIQLIDNVDDLKEKSELLSEVKIISQNLNTTIEHLNEIVTIHTNKKQKRQNIAFKDCLNLVSNSIRNIITSGNAEITHDFNEFPEVRFIPAYLESVLLNLLTNAIKYKHPDRNAKIHFKTGLKGKRGYLEISDNGQGIDLEKYGKHLFGMYQTFHLNSDAVGIGLFITKNQIESQNGTISVKSAVGKGTCFTIIFH